MTWQWVVLVTAVVAEIVLLFAYVAWTNMKMKMFEAIPRTIPDLFKATKATQPVDEDTIIQTGHADEDTIIQAEKLSDWPEKEVK